MEKQNKTNKNEITAQQIWSKYTNSKQYMDGKNLVRETERAWKFYSGDQWATEKKPPELKDLPIVNVIKPIVKYKVATIANQNITAVFSDMNPNHKNYTEVCDRLSKLFDISWEKAKMNRTSWRNLTHCAIQGDSYVYFYDGDTRVVPQILLNTQIFLGDENTIDIQDQPYIIIKERLTLEKTKRRAKEGGASDSDIKLIQTDADTSDEVFNTQEVDDKVTNLLYMTKKDGEVYVARATRDLVYEPLRRVVAIRAKDGTPAGKALSLYPLVSMVWEEVPNSARGTSEVKQHIPNQITLNKNYARRSVSTQAHAFPRGAYNAALLDNPEDLDKVGAWLRVNGDTAQDITKLISYLPPAAMSQDVSRLCDEMLTLTKDLAGASDTAMGNIDPSRVSGTAITTIRDQQQTSLNEQMSMFKDYVENVALMYYEFWQVFYPDGVSFDDVTVTPEELQGVLPNIRIDITEDTTWSRTAEQQEITNLFNNQKLTLAEYAELLPEHSSVPKGKLLQVVKDREAAQNMQPPQIDPNGNPIDTPIDNNVGAEQPYQYQQIQSQLAQNNDY